MGLVGNTIYLQGLRKGFKMGLVGNTLSSRTEEGNQNECSRNLKLTQKVFRTMSIIKNLNKSKVTSDEGHDGT